VPRAPAQSAPACHAAEREIAGTPALAALPRPVPPATTSPASLPSRKAASTPNKPMLAGPTTAARLVPIGTVSPPYGAWRPAVASAHDVLSPLDAPAGNRTCHRHLLHTPSPQNSSLRQSGPSRRTAHPCRSNSGRRCSRGKLLFPSHAFPRIHAGSPSPQDTFPVAPGHTRSNSVIAPSPTTRDSPALDAPPMPGTPNPFLPTAQSASTRAHPASQTAPVPSRMPAPRKSLRYGCSPVVSSESEYNPPPPIFPLTHFPFSAPVRCRFG